MKKKAIIDDVARTYRKTFNKEWKEKLCKYIVTSNNNADIVYEEKKEFEWTDSAASEDEQKQLVPVNSTGTKQAKIILQKQSNLSSCMRLFS